MKIYNDTNDRCHVLETVVNRALPLPIKREHFRRAIHDCHARLSAYKVGNALLTLYVRGLVDMPTDLILLCHSAACHLRPNEAEQVENPPRLQKWFSNQLLIQINVVVCRRLKIEPLLANIKSLFRGVKPKPTRPNARFYRDAAAVIRSTPPAQHGLLLGHMIRYAQSMHTAIERTKEGCHAGQR